MVRCAYPVIYRASLRACFASKISTERSIMAAFFALTFRSLRLLYHSELSVFGQPPTLWLFGSGDRLVSALPGIQT